MTTVVTTPTERPVFVASDDRRARRLRYAAVIAVVVACAWVAALAIGMLGFGRLPNVSLPLVARGADAGHNHRIQPARAAPTAVSKPAAVARARAAAAAAATASNDVKPMSPASAASAAAATRRKISPSRAPRQDAPAQTVQPTTVTAPAHQGWARRGATAPPGQIRRAAPLTVREKIHTALPPGQTRRQGGKDATTAPATPVATPVPPGQQKKADETKQPA